MQIHNNQYGFAAGVWNTKVKKHILCAFSTMPVQWAFRQLRHVCHPVHTSVHLSVLVLVGFSSHCYGRVALISNQMYPLIIVRTLAGIFAVFCCYQPRCLPSLHHQHGVSLCLGCKRSATDKAYTRYNVVASANIAPCLNCTRTGKTLTGTSRGLHMALMPAQKWRIAE